MKTVSLIVLILSTSVHASWFELLLKEQLDIQFSRLLIAHPKLAKDLRKYDKFLEKRGTQDSDDINFLVADSWRGKSGDKRIEKINSSPQLPRISTVIHRMDSEQTILSISSSLRNEGLQVSIETKTAFLDYSAKIDSNSNFRSSLKSRPKVDPELASLEQEDRGAQEITSSPNSNKEANFSSSHR